MSSKRLKETNHMLSRGIIENPSVDEDRTNYTQLPKEIQSMIVDCVNRDEQKEWDAVSRRYRGASYEELKRKFDHMKPDEIMSADPGTLLVYMGKYHEKDYEHYFAIVYNLFTQYYQSKYDDWPRDDVEILTGMLRCDPINHVLSWSRQCHKDSLVAFLTRNYPEALRAIQKEKIQARDTLG